MRAGPAAAVVVLLAVVLMGCTSAGESSGGAGVDPSESRDPPTSAAEGTEPFEASAVPPPDVTATCTAVYEPTADAPAAPLVERARLMLASYPLELDEQQARRYADVDRELVEVIADAPPSMAEQLEVVRRPFADVSATLEGGGGPLEVDTTGVPQALDAVEAICTDGGYDVGA